VCVENLVRFDLMTESLNVGHDGRADFLSRGNGPEQQALIALIRELIKAKE
jgi:hypothetical protein